MSSQINETHKLIRKYKADIASLEEKEEYLTRRIQVMENLIPTVMVWYMWKVAQARKPGTFSLSRSEEEAKKQLLHLENILEELQEADYFLKEEEQVMRSRIEELESLINEEAYELPPEQKYIKKENEVSMERKRIKALEESKIQFEDLLDDPKTDWPNKCKELCDKVNQLTETLAETNDALKNKDGYIKQLQDESRGKVKVVDEKIQDLERQNEAFFSEVISHEKERDAEEAYMNNKVYSAVQEAIEEVETLKSTLKQGRASREEENGQKTNKTKFTPRHDSISEEEEVDSTRDMFSSDSPLQEFYQKPLVLAPDEVLPGAPPSSPKPRASIRPLPQIFESLETLIELSPHADTEEVKLKTTATGTVISIPPDVPQVPSVKPDELSNRRPSSSQFGQPALLDTVAGQPEPTEPAPLDTVAGQPEPTVPSSTLPKDLVVHQIYPSENVISELKTDLTDQEMLKERSVSVTSKPQANIPPITRTSATKSLDKLQLSSTEAEVRVELQPPESLLAPEIKSEIPKALEDQPEVATKVLRSSQSSKRARSSKVSEVIPLDAPPPEVNTIFVKSESQPGPEKAKSTSVTAPEQIPSTSKAPADMSEAQVIMSEPYEVPYTDGIQPTPSAGLALQQQEVGTSKLRPSVDSPAGQTLQSKCRVKDHLIKNLADNLKDLARKNMWSGNKLFKDISSDPVKTYDFDRTTLYKYIKGQEPQDMAPSLQSNGPYSSSNPLIVKLGQKLDKDSLLVKWGPPPSQEVVGFQIFINGEFKYWVHSAKRSKALLHPVDLATRLDITVSPINARGDIVYRSSVTYNP